MNPEREHVSLQALIQTLEDRATLLEKLLLVGANSPSEGSLSDNQAVDVSVQSVERPKSKVLETLDDLYFVAKVLGNLEKDKTHLDMLHSLAVFNKKSKDKILEYDVCYRTDCLG